MVAKEVYVNVKTKNVCKYYHFPGFVLCPKSA